MFCEVIPNHADDTDKSARNQPLNGFYFVLQSKTDVNYKLYCTSAQVTATLSLRNWIVSINKICPVVSYCPSLLA